MIKTRKDLKFYIAEDKKRNMQGSSMPWRVGVYIGHEPSCIFRVIRALRLFEYASNNKRGIYGKLRYILRKIRYRQLEMKYHIFLCENRIGYGFRVVHLAGGVKINCERMGNYCGVNSGVVIGNKGSQENRPVIGDHVGITLGAKVYGKITVGDYATIAPNSVVVKDVPAYAVVSGIPATVLKYIERR